MSFITKLKEFFGIFEPAPVVEKATPKTKKKASPKKKAAAPKKKAAKQADLSSMTKDELVSYARDKKIKINTRARKAEIIAVIEAA